MMTIDPDIGWQVTYMPMPQQQLNSNMRLIYLEDKRKQEKTDSNLFALNRSNF